MKSKYGEPGAPTDPKKYPPTEMNPITWNMVIVERDIEEPIAKPDRYDERRYLMTTKLTAPESAAVGWTHERLFSSNWPPPEYIYQARRLVDHYNLPLTTDRDVILLNFPPQNYPLDVLPQHVVDELEQTEAGASQKNIVQMTRPQSEIIFRDAKRQSLGMLYYLQTIVHERMTPEQRQHSFRRFELS